MLSVKFGSRPRTKLCVTTNICGKRHPQMNGCLNEKHLLLSLTSHNRSDIQLFAMNQSEIHKSSKIFPFFFPLYKNSPSKLRHKLYIAPNTNQVCQPPPFQPTLELFTESNSGMSTWDGDLILHPSQDSSHHQDYEPLLVGNPYKPSFANVTRWEVDPRYGDPKPLDTNLRPQNLLGWSWNLELSLQTSFWKGQSFGYHEYSWIASKTQLTPKNKQP